MRNSDDLKAMIRQRMEERAQMVDKEMDSAPFIEDETEPSQEEIAEVEEELDQLYPEEEDLGGLEEINALLFEVEEEGFNGYVAGQQSEENPYGDNEPLAEAWHEGWFGAHVQTCTTNILLTAKRLVEAKSPEEAEAEMKNLEEAINIAKEVLDFDEATTFWEAVMTGGELSE